jgi:uncharacterized protein YutE (UPF0331/DUF86 family)
MLDHDLIKRKLHLNQKELERLQKFEHMTIEEVAADEAQHAACERYLERLIGRAIDINRHIIGEIGDVTLSVSRYRDTFLALANLGVYPKEFAEKIAPSVGLRNALVHDYNNIDEVLFKKSIGEAIEEYNEYAKYILAFLDKQKQ